MADVSDDGGDPASEGLPFQSLYRRFRPSTFAEVKGQDHVVLALRNAVRDGRVAHAYLFSGPRGTGKTSTARILAKALNCTDLRDGEPCGVCSPCTEIAKGSSLDVHELDAASNNGVEAMRDLVSRAALGTPGRQKVYIVDEVHMLSTPASNALLKTLEEPPSHVIFVLATTDPQKVLPTIRSRTQHYEFRLLGADTLNDLLEQVRRDAHLDVSDEALDVAVRRGRGSARDALSVLDQAAASDTLEDDLPQLDEIVGALAERDAGRALVAVAHLTAAGFSPLQLAGDLIDVLRQGFLAMVAPELVGVVGTEAETIGEVAGRLGLPALVRAMEVLGRAQVAMRDVLDPRVSLEVALVRLAHPEADETPEAMLVRIERLERGGVTLGPPAGSRQLPTAPEVPTAPALPTAGEHPTSGAAAARRTLGAVQRETPIPTPTPTAAPTPTPTAAPIPASTPTLAYAHAPEPASPGSGLTLGDRPAPEGAEPVGIPVFPTRDQLAQAWGDHILGRLRPKAKALFQAGRFVGTADGKAVFGLPNETHRRRCEDIRGDIESALSEYFGQPVKLSLVVENNVKSPGPDAQESRPSQGIGASGGASVRESGGASVQPGHATNSTPTGPEAPMAEVPADDDDDDDDDAMSAFDDPGPSSTVSIDNSMQARLMQAFPGAEEVL